MAKRTLLDLGWNDTFAEHFAPYKAEGWVPARLIRETKINYSALMVAKGAFDEVDCILSGKVYHDAINDAELPAVGDWVALDVSTDDVVIRARLPRQGCLSRKAPGDITMEQVIAANIQTAMVITDPGPDFSLRRLERYFAVVARSGAQAVVLINKADLYAKDDLASAAAMVRELDANAHVHVISVLAETNLKVMREYLRPGHSVAMIGSSGVGKSALINYLLGGDYQEIGDVNELTGKGRHTTTSRELMVLRKGGIIIDNPGIKEVQLWMDETILRERFADISAMAFQCKFVNCKHGSDTGCVIQEALISGKLDGERYEGFMRLEEEVEKLRLRQKKRQMTIERIHKRDNHGKLRNRDDRNAQDWKHRLRHDDD
jgi:ribosome biogenesis GTPase / thiamine phosphate phosphatase